MYFVPDDPDDTEIFANGMPISISGKTIRERGKDIAYLYAALTAYAVDSSPNDEEFFYNEDKVKYAYVSVNLIYSVLKNYYTKDEIKAIVKRAVAEGLLSIQEQLSDIDGGDLYVEID